MAAPKVYGFDSGFVCAYRGWTSLRSDDLGHLWEHYVLNELAAHVQTSDLRYWRDKQGHEVDLVWLSRGKNPVAIECKWTTRDFDPTNLLVFSRLYPKATCLVTAPDALPSFTREYNAIQVQFMTLDRLIASLKQSQIRQ